ncbi:IFN protein, partial [Vidua chalybeata]|nr:IFN protein [Vidua chalybeata]
QPRLPHAAPPLLLLLTALATSLACQHLWTHDDTFPGDALRLLQDTAPSHTQPCHLQEPPFFPDTLLHDNLHPHQAAATALRILQHLFHTLSSTAPASLARSTARNQLLNCISTTSTTRAMPPRQRPALQRTAPTRCSALYFRDIHLFLLAHNHSACAWDHVRLEARASLRHLHNLTRTMR